MPCSPPGGHGLLSQIERLIQNSRFFFILIGFVGMDHSLVDSYNNMTIPLTMAEWNIDKPSGLIATDGLLMIAASGKKNSSGYR